MRFDVVYMVWMRSRPVFIFSRSMSPRFARTGAASILVYVAAVRHCVLARDVFWDLEHGWLIRDVAATA